MDLVKMKAIAVGTIVGDTVNSQGEINSGCIIHVDPDNHGENGRYSEPLVLESVAKKLEADKLAERTGTAKLENGMLISGVDADLAAERVGEVSEIDAKSPGAGPAALDTRNSVNFEDGDRVRGGAAGTMDAPDDADAAPAPRTKTAAAKGDGAK